MLKADKRRQEKSVVIKRIVEKGVRVGKAVVGVGQMILLELMEGIEDMEYMRTHSYSVIGRDVRSARYESEEGKRLYELRMKRQTIKRLRQQKFIKLRREGERVICELTKNGRIKALQASILVSDNYFYDGRTCLVSFDFPEASRAARNVFRKFLKGAGFLFVQGSVWAVNKDAARTIKEIVSILKIGRWVEVYTAAK